MVDLYLKAATEAAMVAALQAAGVAPETGYAVDHIGPFTRDGVDYPDWHCNLRGHFTDEQMLILGPMNVAPDQPFRVFA